MAGVKTRRRVKAAGCEFEHHLNLFACHMKLLSDFVNI
jgi:hypothetical protein